MSESGATGRSVRVGAAALLTAALLGGALAACTPQAAPEPSGSPTASDAPSDGATDDPTDGPPELDPDGDADDNLAFFDQVNAQTLAANPDPGGRGFLDALIAAGFEKADMEVTSDTDTLGARTDNLQFSVRINGTCLLGQFGNVGYVSDTADVLTTGRCLIGATRPIDW